jgi:trigger factor
VRRNEREPATEGVKASLLLEKVAEREGLVVSEEVLSAEIERFATALDKSPSAIRAQMSKEGTLDRVRSRLRREKAVDFIKQHAKLQ